MPLAVILLAQAPTAIVEMGAPSLAFQEWHLLASLTEVSLSLSDLVLWSLMPLKTASSMLV